MRLSAEVQCILPSSDATQFMTALAYVYIVVYV